jgi:PAS domain S-box-containing protein
MGDNVSGVSSANRQFDRTASVDNGREAMKRTQSIIATMTGEENRLLKERNEAMRSSSRLAMTVIVGGALFALLVIGSATRIINTDLTERERQAALIDQTHDAVLAWDWNGPITFWNRGAERLYGFSRAEAVGQVSHDLLRTRAQGGVETFIHSLEREGMWDGEVEHTTRDGRPITVETRMVFVREGGDYVIEVNRDITERKRAEEGMKKLNQDLERRSGELEAINKELDAFTYSVSHDLRAPLRHLDGFSKILLEEYGVQLPADAQHHLKRIREAASNMGLLVDGLLHLAHLGRTEPTLQLVGLNSIVEKVVRDLSPETRQRKIEWQIGTLPSVECDATLLENVFVNLLSNAIKYTRPRQPARIEVNQVTKNGETAIVVRDNGVGFSMKHADKLFGVFQRLHRQEDFEGNGVGLATVQRIVHKHGGRVWADAEIDKGAAFFFTLGTLTEKQRTNPNQETNPNGNKRS